MFDENGAINRVFSKLYTIFILNHNLTIFERSKKLKLKKFRLTALKRNKTSNNNERLIAQH